MPLPKLKFSVIGCGRMGKRRLKCIRDHPEATVVGVSDSSKSLGEQVGREFGVPHHSDWRAALDENSDVVVISTPNEFHAEIAIRALELGKHVFCEKPLARNVSESREMVRVAIKSRGSLKTGSNVRYFPNVLAARALISAGKLGKILFVRSWIGHNGWNLANEWFGQVKPSGGGTFLDNGSHIFDLIRLFMGEISDCVGLVQTSHWEVAPLEDNGMGVFRSHQGNLAMVHSSWTEWAGYFYIEIYGTEGFLRLDSRGSTCSIETGTREGKVTKQDFSQLPPSSYRDEFADYVQRLRKGGQPEPSGYDGLRAVQMAHGVYDCSRTGAKADLWTAEDRLLFEQVRSAGARFSK